MVRSESIKFYDMKARKTVMVPEEKTWIEIKGKKKNMKMRVAYGAAGNKIYRIVGRV